jgi:ParB family chromosome partitioning protein
LTSVSGFAKLNLMAKPALGRGLGALLGGKPIAKPPPPAEVSKTPAVDSTAPASGSDAVRRVPLTKVVPCPFQPRKAFAPEALQELADSIREQGIVQPLVVREQAGKFELIAGERRWRAAQLVGLKEVPVIVRVADDRTVLELALIENLQRENLNAIEEAQGYSQLQEQFSLTQEEVATKVGKSRAAVANALRLLKLPVPVQEKLRRDELSVGHAKVILGLPTDKLQSTAADRIIAEKLNVRQTEALVAKLLARASSAPAAAVIIPPRDAHIASLENSIRERVGTKVHLRYHQGKGSLEIAFFSDAELERILEILGVRND